jgi:integrase
MPKTKRGKPLHHRGGFRLYPREGRAHEIVWYDVAAGRERTASAGTTEIEEAEAALDAKYLEITKGIRSCPTCRRPFETQGRLVTEAIELARHEAEGKASEDAINPRLDHVTAYIATLTSPAVMCAEVNEGWIGKFRTWAKDRPIVTPGGTEKVRSLSTVENSVLQLASAIRGIGEVPRFKPKPMKEVNRSPKHRSDVKELAAMLRYALVPKRRRENLLAFLRASIVTLGRPDAVLDISTDPKRDQWMASARVLALNPKGRQQTRKYRATVPIAEPAAWILGECSGFLIPAASVKSAWNGMATELKLPGDGEGGTKLIRRSMAKLLRDRLPRADWIEIEMFLGHRKFDATSDIYAPFDPDYLSKAKAEIEAIISELESLAPGAFYRDFTAQGGNVSSIAMAKNA